MADNKNLNVQIIEDLGDPIPGTSVSVQENSFCYPAHERIKTGFGRMIRSSLPNIGNHLKRLMRFKSQREVNYTADNLKEGEVEEVNEGEDEDAISNETVASDLNDSFQSSNLTSNFTLEHPSMSLYLDNNISPSSSDQMEISIRPSNLFQYYSTNFPLASSSLFTNNIPAESDMTVSTLYYPTSGVNPLMISQSVNTSSNIINDRTFTDLINEEGVIVAGNPFEYAATLHVPVGNENNNRLTYEPRRVPLIVSDNNYIASFNIDNSISSGSESSSESVIISELGETDSLMRRRRHEVRQLYDIAMRQNVRKPFLYYDDEPSIY
ncbi:uncharacterized protein LOC130667702 [Microplitis mediator]|uniref:uncharacterized protein LOC130667702 n=1 Tax=Microplitis mediator TaxID=375433 RepID=UPI00255357D0|nr:uncharacterized protein LOC130667702 [Microplitis mediator]